MILKQIAFKSFLNSWIRYFSMNSVLFSFKSARKFNGKNDILLDCQNKPPLQLSLLQPLDYLGSKAGGPVKGDLQPQFLYEEIV